VVVDQGQGPLADRLATSWSATAGPALQVGMDTPQVSAADLDRAMARLVDGSGQAVLGPAEDGGWWALGLRRPHRAAFRGIPTSRPDTGQRQLARLRRLGLRPALLAVERDVDTWDDALAVAAQAPGSAFAAAVRSTLVAAS
jgi:glycosyltransferase A (GT-A) superfamily protein (DUF2064 family)